MARAHGPSVIALVPLRVHRQSLPRLFTVGIRTMVVVAVQGAPAFLFNSKPITLRDVPARPEAVRPAKPRLVGIP